MSDSNTSCSFQSNRIATNNRKVCTHRLVFSVKDTGSQSMKALKKKKERYRAYYLVAQSGQHKHMFLFTSRKHDRTNSHGLDFYVSCCSFWETCLRGAGKRVRGKQMSNAENDSIASWSAKLASVEWLHGSLTRHRSLKWPWRYSQFTVTQIHHLTTKRTQSPHVTRSRLSGHRLSLRWNYEKMLESVRKQIDSLTTRA